MKVLAEYALVACGALFLGTAILQFLWFFSETYPRSVPTLVSIPACLIAMFFCLSKAAEIGIARFSS